MLSIPILSLPLTGCGRTLQDSSGTFSSPPYKNEDNSIEKPEQLCQWRISATHGEKIVLNITSLDLPDQQGCENDYLEVRDGHWIKSALIGKFRIVSHFLKVEHGFDRSIPPCPENSTLLRLKI